MTVKLSSSNLSSLPGNVAVPKYDRSKLKAGIVHFGVGNFHRSHQAVYLDDLFNSGVGHDWALVGESVPYGRMGTAQDLTGMAVFLASDEAEYIVAQTYNVDGGQWMS